LNLLAGNDEHVTAPEHSSAGKPSGLVQIVPANDTLFTSGTLGRYSQALNSVLENRRTQEENLVIE
jgi:NADH-quinone oxidoreductase subunit G